ncbi:hypothetical protein BSKO_13028 [Bryopsis sp. KO-2023]|nr:hypothetical protein BSKO_13028 [Bryopsis sp. KO-2023]
MLATAFAILETGNSLATKEQELRSWAKKLRNQETLLKTRQMRLHHEQEKIKANMEEMRITMSGQLAQERESLQEWQIMLENREKELERKAVEENPKPAPRLPFTFSAGPDECDRHQEAAATQRRLTEGFSAYLASKEEELDEQQRCISPDYG